LLNFSLAIFMDGYVASRGQRTTRVCTPFFILPEGSKRRKRGQAQHRHMIFTQVQGIRCGTPTSCLFDLLLPKPPIQICSLPPPSLKDLSSTKPSFYTTMHATQVSCVLRAGRAVRQVFNYLLQTRLSFHSPSRSAHPREGLENTRGTLIGSAPV
jgi:hypothetical protein